MLEIIYKIQEIAKEGYMQSALHALFQHSTYKTNLPKFAFVSKGEHLFLHVSVSKNQVKAILILASASPLSYLEILRSVLLFFSLPVPQAFQLLLEYFSFLCFYLMSGVLSKDFGWIIFHLQSNFL